MENGVGKTTVTCDDPSSPPPPPTFCPGFPFCDNQGNGGIETHGSWPGVDTQGHWPGQQGNWPGQRGDNIQLHVDWPGVIFASGRILLGISVLGGLLGLG